MILFYVNKVVVKARIDQSLTDETETVQHISIQCSECTADSWHTQNTHRGYVFTRAAVDPSVFTIKEKAPGAFSWLKAPTRAFTFNTLLRNYAKLALTQG